MQEYLMEHPSVMNGAILVLVIIGLCIAVAWPSVRERLFLRGSGGGVMPSSQDPSVLLLAYSQGLLVRQMSDGEIGGLHYNLLVTEPLLSSYGDEARTAPPGTLLYRVELPFHTSAHILGLAVSEGWDPLVFQPYLTANKMTRVSLEGTFDQTCLVYAKKGQGVQTRYVLDPRAMEFIVERCSGFHWEIVGDELYFASEPTMTRGVSNAVIAAQAKDFVAQIQPALISRLPGHDLPGRAPYGEHRGKPFACPVCASSLVAEKHWYSCPKGHGDLIAGQQLLAVRDGNTVPDDEPTAAVERRTQLTCPNCSNQMVRTNYVSSGVMIDSCTTCAYRWCDAGELSKIAL